ncbi:hypothetical protein RRG08_001880 [Elysia crispata]|uniref:Uncharacterized protein n=1 Tax=Elysia crispata TaxID=231223 RepID=A0AAE0YHX5_9GAST|nr:hypothetical protein RRG08_001880 [Elysia crispata]
MHQDTGTEEKPAKCIKKQVRKRNRQNTSRYRYGRETGKIRQDTGTEEKPAKYVKIQVRKRNRKNTSGYRCRRETGKTHYDSRLKHSSVLGLALLPHLPFPPRTLSAPGFSRGDKCWRDQGIELTQPPANGSGASTAPLEGQQTQAYVNVIIAENTGEHCQ